MGFTNLKATSCTLLKNMKVISAYMLAVVGGNAKPSVADCKKILSSVGIDLDDDSNKRLEELVEEMSGKELAESLRLARKSSRLFLVAVAVVPQLLAVPLAPQLLAVMLLLLLRRRSPRKRRISLLQVVCPMRAMTIKLWDHLLDNLSVKCNWMP